MNGEKEMKEVLLEVEGGVVSAVCIPKGIKVIVHDFDIDGVDEDRLMEDGYNNKFVRTEFTEEDEV